MISLEKILGTTIKDRKALSTLRGAVTDDLVIGNPHYLAIMEWVVDFYDKYEKLPTEQDAHVWMLTLPNERQKAVRSAWKELYNQNLEGYTLEFLADTALKELRNIATRNASRRLASMGDRVDPEMLQSFNERISKINPIELTDIAKLSNVGKWAKPQDETDEIRHTTGIPKLDRIIGGFGEELSFVMAESGKGKTTTLMNFGQAAALQGARVLHISYELHLYAMTQRYYRRIAEATKTEYNEDIEQVRGRLEKWFSLARGDIYTKYFDSYSMTVDDLKNFVDLFVEKEGEIDVLILDYLDLLKRTSEQSRLPRDEQERRLSHEVRAITSKYGCAVHSAAQATREGYGKERLTLKHMGGGLAKLQAADLVFGLVQTEEEEKKKQGRLGCLKVRENAGGGEIPLYINLDRMVIMDLDDPDARRLRLETRRNK